MRLFRIFLGGSSAPTFTASIRTSAWIIFPTNPRHPPDDFGLLESCTRPNWNEVHAHDALVSCTVEARGWWTLSLLYHEVPTTRVSTAVKNAVRWWALLLYGTSRTFHGAGLGSGMSMSDVGFGRGPSAGVMWIVGFYCVVDCKCWVYLIEFR